MEMFYRNWRWLVLSFGGWTLFGVFFALQNYVNAVYFGQDISFWTTLAVWLICGYAWMLLTPLVVFLAERFFIKSGQIRRNLLVHFIAGAAISLFQLAVFIFARQWLLGNSQKTFSFSADFQKLLVGEFHVNLIVYWIVVGIAHLRLINRRYLERMRESARLALSTSQLETELAHAQLDALKMQLHPHFLFNTLNSISVLMRDDVKAANRMLVRLSELLRAALKSEGLQEVSLRQELEFLRGYLEIEQTRFQDRLTVDFAVESETLDAQVPNLILQPIVENAIRHGIAPLATAGLIQVRARRENGFVELQITDNGAGLSESKTQTDGGIGLANTQKRLEKLYGEKYKFEMSSPETGGLQVKIKIPFHTNGDGK